MVQAIIKLGEYEDRVLTIIKGKYGLKNKSEAINFVINQFDKELLEPELRPEYVKKIRNLEKKGQFIKFNTLEEVEKEIRKREE